MTRLALGAFLLIAASGCATSHASRSNASAEQVEIKGPLILAFLPSVSDAAEAVAHVEFALADTKKCLGDRGVELRVAQATDLVLVQGSRRTFVHIPNDDEHSIGAYLLDLDREPCVVYSKGGASSLQVILPAAAGEYFGVANCSDASAGKLCGKHDG